MLQRSGQYEFPMSSADFLARLSQLIQHSRNLVVSKGSNQKVRLHTKSGYGMLSAVEPYHYYIDLTIREGSQGINVTASYRGNATLSISLLLLLMMSIPIFLVLLSDRPDTDMVLIPIIAGFIVLPVLLFYYNYRRQQWRARLEMEKIFTEMV